MPKVSPLRDRAPDAEKVTVNLGYVDLGRIDLLVREGFFSNRTDFIRAAVRDALARHDDTLDRSRAHHALDLGLRRFTRADLKAAVEAGKKLDIRVLGLAVIDDDVPLALAEEAIGSITVLGALQARREIKAALADRIR